MHYYLAIKVINTLLNNVFLPNTYGERGRVAQALLFLGACCDALETLAKLTYYFHVYISGQ